MKPFKVDDEATVIYHNTFVVMPNKAVISQLEARGIKTHCKNYQTPRGNKIYPDLPEIVAPYHLFSDNPVAIAQDIIAAIKNPKIRLIIFPNGGNGMAEIVDLIEQERLKGNLPKRNDMFFVGFSDTEKAINYLAHNCGFGQAIISSRVTGKNLEDIVDSISKEGHQTQQLKPINEAAKASDELRGNLISASCDEHDEGYSRIEPLKGDIVFLENFPRGLKEQLEIYARKGLLQNIQAFALSSNFFEKDLETINEEAEQIFKKYNIAPIPIFHGIDCGHGVPNDKAKHLVLQTDISIKRDGENFSAKISNLRTNENIKTLATAILEREKFTRFESHIQTPEEYRATQFEGELFCHAINTAHGQRAEGIKDVIRKNPAEKFSVTINMPDFSDFNSDESIKKLAEEFIKELAKKPEKLAEEFIKELAYELAKKQQDKWTSDQQIKAIQMCLMDLKLNGYTNNIEQLTIASRLDFSASVMEWLSDFQKRILPEITCQTKASGIANPQEIALRNSIDQEFSKGTKKGLDEAELKKQFLFTVLDPEYPYLQQIQNIIANAKDNEGQSFFSEEIRIKAKKLTNEDADKLLFEIVDLIYKKNPENKPERMISQSSGNGTKTEFFTKLYEDLASGNCLARIDSGHIKTIEQFTPIGLDTAVEYYNQKYPEREKIHRTQLLMDDLSDRVKFIKTACDDLLPLKQDGAGHKILLTLARKNLKAPSGISLDHSIPFVLTGDKLILMRDENDSFGQALFEDIAKGLGVKFIQSSEPIYDKKDPKRTSIQGDYASCHFIALGILKDLTTEDLRTISTFDNGFKYLPKSLKYSQSVNHIRNVLDEKSAQEPVKQDGRTAEQYAKQHKAITKEGSVATRISDKFNKFKTDLSGAIKPAKEITPQAIAAAVLNKRKLQKEEKESFVDKFGLGQKTKTSSFVEAAKATEAAKSDIESRGKSA